MKRKIMLALILALIASAGVIASNTETNPLVKIREQVLVTEKGTFPSTVRLVDPEGHTYCSGSVVDEGMVLTAAHCIFGATVIMSEPNKDGQVAMVPAMPLVIVPRADYAILIGDFSGFTVMPTETDPEMDLLYNQTELVSCGFPWGDKLTCYPILTKIAKYFTGFSAEGQMYPAMSGGPVIDVRTGKIVGVNHAIGDNRIFFMPLTGISTRIREALGE